MMRRNPERYLLRRALVENGTFQTSGIVGSMSVAAGIADIRRQL